MWFFKRKKGLPLQAAIHQECYDKLPDTLKSRFYAAPAGTEPTHKVDQLEDGVGDFWLVDAAIGELAVSLGTEANPTENYSIDPPAADPAADTGGDFGGGDGGGAGAGDSY